MSEKDRNIRKDEGEDVEGHVNHPHTKPHTDEGEDVEGHTLKPHVKPHVKGREDDDAVEAHAFKQSQKASHTP